MITLVTSKLHAISNYCVTYINKRKSGTVLPVSGPGVR
jgi:hypothetical protein